MHLITRTSRLVVTGLLAGALALVSVPAEAASGASAAPDAAQDKLVSTTSDDRAAVRLEGDSVSSTSRSSRRASYAWTGRRIYYYETIADKWDWSLRTAINKWNHSGGGIRFVRTTSPSRAQLKISSRDIGAAAGKATIGRTRRAFVRLSSGYDHVDELSAHYRIEVMMIFAHELGHVLGFGHSQVRCSLMSALLDVEGCRVIPTDHPGYYKCRTISRPLAARFVRIYGGQAKFPDSWCPIDKIPASLTDVGITGGSDAPVTISWTSPSSVPTGARVKISSWASESCDVLPVDAGTSYAAVDDGSWQGTAGTEGSSSCFRVQLVNRYGAGQEAVARMLSY